MNLLDDLDVTVKPFNQKLTRKKERVWTKDGSCYLRKLSFNKIGVNTSDNGVLIAKFVVYHEGQRTIYNTVGIIRKFWRYEYRDVAYSDYIDAMQPFSTKHIVTFRNLLISGSTFEEAYNVFML